MKWRNIDFQTKFKAVEAIIFYVNSWFFFNLTNHFRETTKYWADRGDLGGYTFLELFNSLLENFIILFLTYVLTLFPVSTSAVLNYLLSRKFSHRKTAALSSIFATAYLLVATCIIAPSLLEGGWVPPICGLMFLGSYFFSLEALLHLFGQK